VTGLEGLDVAKRQLPPFKFFVGVDVLDGRGDETDVITKRNLRDHVAFERGGAIRQNRGTCHSGTPGDCCEVVDVISSVFAEERGKRPVCLRKDVNSEPCSGVGNLVGSISDGETDEKARRFRRQSELIG
jgi:hypothetical protein